MSYFPRFGYSKQNIEIELDFSNDGRKFDLKNATSGRQIKPEVDILDIDNKLGELDANKLKAVHIDLKKLSDAVDKKLVKKDVYNAKIRDVEHKIPDIATLVSAAKTNKVKGKICSITNLATTTALTTGKNKISKATTDLVKKADYDAEIKDISPHLS